MLQMKLKVTTMNSEMAYPFPRHQWHLVQAHLTRIGTNLSEFLLRRVLLAQLILQYIGLGTFFRVTWRPTFWQQSEQWYY